MRSYEFKVTSDNRDFPLSMTEKVDEANLSEKHIEALLDSLVKKYQESPDSVKLRFLNKLNRA